MLYGTRQNVLLEALTALLELHRFEDKARVAAESARIIGQLARIEERRAELGAVGRNDLRQAASRQAGALAQQHALESQRMDAQARFTRYFGFTPQPGWLPQLNVPVQWMPANEDSALQASETVSPELQEMEQQIEKARAEVDRSKSQRFPTLAAVVAHTRDPSGVLYAEGTRYGVELSWNFGNGFELRDRILKAINELQAQEAQQETVRRQVRETASAAWGRTQSGRQRESQLADAVREARAAFEGRRRLLEVGARQPGPGAGRPAGHAAPAAGRGRRHLRPAHQRTAPGTHHRPPPAPGPARSMAERAVHPAKTDSGRWWCARHCPHGRARPCALAHPPRTPGRCRGHPVRQRHAPTNTAAP